MDDPRRPPPGRDEDRAAAAPEVGAGSARWFHRLGERQVAASAFGGFVGSLLGQVFGGLQVYWDDDQLRIGSHGLVVSLSARDADHVADVVRGRRKRRAEAYHLGTTDEDLALAATWTRS